MLLMIGTIAGVVLLGGGVVYAAVQRERARTWQIGEVATRMRWTYEAAPALPPAIPGIEPFARGRRHRARNRVAHERGGEPAAAFDLGYITGSGQHAQRHSIGMAQLPLTRAVPVFAVRPEHLGHRLAGALGMQDIDFAERPRFSTLFLLRGPDEAAIRTAFTPAVLEFFEAHPGLGAASTGRELFVWQPARVAPEHLETFLAMAGELRRRLER